LPVEVYVPLFNVIEPPEIVVFPFILRLPVPVNKIVPVPEFVRLPFEVVASLPVEKDMYPVLVTEPAIETDAVNPVKESLLVNPAALKVPIEEYVILPLFSTDPEAELRVKAPLLTSNVPPLLIVTAVPLPPTVNVFAPIFKEPPLIVTELDTVSFKNVAVTELPVPGSQLIL